MLGLYVDNNGRRSRQQEIMWPAYPVAICKCYFNLFLQACAFWVFFCAYLNSLLNWDYSIQYFSPQFCKFFLTYWKGFFCLSFPIIQHKYFLLFGNVFLKMFFHGLLVLIILFLFFDSHQHSLPSVLYRKLYICLWY